MAASSPPAWLAFVRRVDAASGADPDFAALLAEMVRATDARVAALAAARAGELAVTRAPSGPQAGLRAWLDAAVAGASAGAWRVLRASVVEERALRGERVWAWTCVACFSRARPAGDDASCARVVVVVDARGAFPGVAVLSATFEGTASEGELLAPGAGRRPGAAAAT